MGLGTPRGVVFGTLTAILGWGAVDLEALSSVEPALGVVRGPWLWYEDCSGSSLVGQTALLARCMRRY